SALPTVFRFPAASRAPLFPTPDARPTTSAERAYEPLSPRPARGLVKRATASRAPHFVQQAPLARSCRRSVPRGRRNAIARSSRLNGPAPRRDVAVFAIAAVLPVATKAEQVVRHRIDRAGTPIDIWVAPWV